MTCRASCNFVPAIPRNSQSWPPKNFYQYPDWHCAFFATRGSISNRSLRIGLHTISGGHVVWRGVFGRARTHTQTYPADARQGARACSTARRLRDVAACESLKPTPVMWQGGGVGRTQAQTQEEREVFFFLLCSKRKDRKTCIRTRDGGEKMRKRERKGKDLKIDE